MYLEKLEINNFVVELPIGMEEPLVTKVRDSYQTFLRTSTKDVVRHLTCFSTLVPPLLSDWRGGQAVLHPFGGVGACAQILDQCLPALRHTLWDRDPACFEWLRGRYEDVTLVADSFKMLGHAPLELYRAILLDMSVNTIKTPTTIAMWETVAKWMTPDKLVWFTDTACHKMHLNWRSYERDFGHEIENTNFSYMVAYSNWLEDNFGITITGAMAEAGMTYCVASSADDAKRFQSIPYV